MSSYDAGDSYGLYHCPLYILMKHAQMSVNDFFLIIYPIHIVSDKTGTGKILFSLNYRI
jgi:hypothetical protein